MFEGIKTREEGAAVSALICGLAIMVIGAGGLIFAVYWAATAGNINSVTVSSSTLGVMSVLAIMNGRLMIVDSRVERLQGEIKKLKAQIDKKD